jgi:hypothetical protein
LIRSRIVRFDDALLPSFWVRRGLFPKLSDEEFRRHLRFILFEFVGSVIILVGMAFCSILEAWLGGQFDLDAFARDAQKEDTSAAIDEALRLSSPTNYLFRRVRRRATVSAATMNPGDYACLLVRHASRDWRAFRDPAAMLPNDSRPYLTFGPKGGPHACYGQYWARAILQEMLVALASLPNLRPVDPHARGASTFQGLPDYLALDYSTRTG